MKVPRFFCAVTLAVIAGVSYPRSGMAKEIPSKAPVNWRVELSWKAVSRHSEIRTEISQSAYPPQHAQMVVKYGVMKDGKRTYRQLYCNVIDEKETAMIYQAAAQSLNDFRFAAAFPNRTAVTPR